MSEQLTLSQDWDCQLSAFERRIAAKRAYAGLKLWAIIFRRKLVAMRQRDRAVQCELMQVEYAVKHGSVEAALAHLEKAKFMLSCLCLGLVLWNTFGDSFVRRRAGAKPSARVLHVRRIKRRDGEGFFLILGEEALG